jgi:hypothetical protein
MASWNFEGRLLISNHDISGSPHVHHAPTFTALLTVIQNKMYMLRQSGEPGKEVGDQALSGGRLNDMGDCWS